MAPLDSSGPTFTSAPGAVYNPIHLVRDVRIYPIEEHELTTLNLFSGIVTVVASIASLALAFGLSCWWDVMANPGDKAKVALGHGVMAVCGVVIVISAAIGYWAQHSKNNELTKILSESRVIGPKQ